jgi:hypothetical protein
MAVTVKINGIDRSGVVDFSTLEVQMNLYSEPDECRFEILRHEGQTYVPQCGDTVEVWDGSIKIFGGLIVAIERSMESAKLEKFTIEAKDWSEEMDRRIVFNVYENKTVNEIIADLLANWASGFTMNNVDCNIEIARVIFRGKPVSQCIDELAQLTGYYWYIDPYKDVHFFAKGTEVAPFDLTDTNGKYIFSSLRLKEDWLQIKNAVQLEGSTFTGTNYVEYEIKVLENDVNEKRTVFDTIVKFAELPSVYLNGRQLRVGVDGVDNLEDFDVLWNFNEKTIKFREDNRPGLFDVIKMRGKELLPMILRGKDVASIATYGIKEYYEIDKTIRTREQAAQKVSAILEAWKEKVFEGSFQTYEPGIFPGQKIRIQSDIREIDQEFFVKTVNFRMRTQSEFIYEVEIMTQRTADLIDFLQKQLLDKMKEVDLTEEEYLTDYLQTDETISIAESLTKAKGSESNTTPIWVAGPYFPGDWPTDNKRAMRANTGAKCRV